MAHQLVRDAIRSSSADTLLWRELCLFLHPLCHLLSVSVCSGIQGSDCSCSLCYFHHCMVSVHSTVAHNLQFIAPTPSLLLPIAPMYMFELKLYSGKYTHEFYIFCPFANISAEFFFSCTSFIFIINYGELTHVFCCTNFSFYSINYSKPFLCIHENIIDQML